MDGETTLASVSGNTESVFSEKAQAPVSNSSTDKPAHFLQSIWKRIATKEGLFVGLVFLLAFIVRAYLMRFELFFEFDSYWHARMVSYLLQGLPIPALDPLAYYHNAASAAIINAPVLFWYISVAFYKIFTLNAPYNFETLVLWVKILPALYGAIICVAMYFLGKELFKGPHEKAAGIFIGVFAAIVPAFVYRTMGGFFEDDSLGFIWMVLGFIFLMRAFREPKWDRHCITNAVLAGLSFVLMVFTWPAFNMLVPILLGMGVVQFLLWINEKEYTKASAYAKLWLISFLMLGIAATIHTGFFWLSQFGGILGSLFLRNSDAVQYEGVLVFIALLLIAAYLVLHFARRNKLPEKGIKIALAIVLLGIVLAPFIVNLFNISLSLNAGAGSSIGEESEGRNYFGNKYSFLILLAGIGLPAIGYLLWKRPRHFEGLVLPLVWFVVTFFMAWGKLKFTYYMGLPLALMSGVVCVLALKWMDTHSIQTKKVVAFFIGFILLGGIAAGTIFVTQNVPNIEAAPGWKTALFWADDHLPADAKFFNWWDEGHWISFLSGRKVLIDNRNADPVAAADVARFLISTDTESARAIVDQYKSTHLIFGWDLLEKLTNLGYYAYGITNPNDPRIRGMVGFVTQCQFVLSPLTKQQSYVCGANTLTVEQMNAFPTTWKKTPNNLQDGSPLFVYRDLENKWIYAFSTAANDTMLVRLWFNETTAREEFTPIYQNTNEVRIWEVIEPVSSE